MREWHLRLARADDAAFFPAIERAAAALFEDWPGLGTFDRDAVRSPAEFRRLIRKGHSLAARVGDAPAGFLVAEPFGRELHLWEVSVAPRFQQRGIGAGLVRACLIDARNVGFGAVTLTTFCDVPWNAPFYRRLGFADVQDHPRLEALLSEEVGHGFAADSRCAMVQRLG